MSEYELQDLAFTAGGLGITFASLLISIISAYLIVAYTAGRELTRHQVTLVNFLFLFASCLFLYGTVTSFGKQFSLVEQLRELSPDSFYPTTIPVVALITICFSLIILASLWFMWSMRHPRN